MIKLNLLPKYILERRRVKAWALGMAALLIIELVVLAAYVWGPMPFSLRHRMAAAEAEAAEQLAAAQEVEKLNTEIDQINGRFAAKASSGSPPPSCSPAARAFSRACGTCRTTRPRGL